MTTQQAKVIRNIEAQHEAQRFNAEQAAREAELDAVSVLYAVQVKIAEGRIEEARAMVEAYRASQKGA
jgi:hypothetical protein